MFYKDKNSKGEWIWPESINDDVGHKWNKEFIASMFIHYRCCKCNILWELAEGRISYYGHNLRTNKKPECSAELRLQALL